MSTTYINRITIKKDGVYLSLKARGDRNYHSSYNSTLTDIYKKEGCEGLNREIIKMIYEYCTLIGKHQSIEKYQFVLKTPDAQVIWKKHKKERDEKYEELEPADIASRYRIPTEAMREYMLFDEKSRDAAYAEIAELCKIYDAGLEDDYYKILLLIHENESCQDIMDYFYSTGYKEEYEDCVREMERRKAEIAALKDKIAAVYKK